MGNSNTSEETITISDVLVEYSELEGPETAAHQLWLCANWLNDQLDIGMPDDGLTDKNQEVMVIEEEKQGGFIEIHHTHSEQVPLKISSIIPDTACTIAGAESQMHSDRNIVHSIIWIVPEATVDDWEQPKPDFDQYESFDKGKSETTSVGKPGQEKDGDSTKSDSKSESTSKSKKTSSHNVKNRRPSRTRTSAPGIGFNPIRTAVAMIPMALFLVMYESLMSPILQPMATVSPMSATLIQTMDAFIPIMIGIAVLGSVIFGFGGGSRL